jgi:hypothetical protein
MVKTLLDYSNDFWMTFSLYGREQFNFNFFNKKLIHSSLLSSLLLNSPPPSNVILKSHTTVSATRQNQFHFWTPGVPIEKGEN